MQIDHVSVSRAKTYLQCAKLYKYRYHDKLPSPVPEPFYFVYGKIVHKIAESFVEGGGKKSIGEVQQDVLRGKIEVEPGKVAPAIPPEYKRRMPLHLKAIKSMTDKLGYEGHLEYPFQLDLDPPKEKYLVGFIDRLVIKGDKAFVLDYKTTKPGKFRVNATTVTTDLQLRTYARIVQRDFGILPENILCTLYYLEDGEKASAKFSEATLVNTEKELLAIYDKIVAHDPDTVVGTPGGHCYNCQYKTICPFFGRSGTWATPNWDGHVAGDPWSMS